MFHKLLRCAVVLLLSSQPLWLLAQGASMRLHALADRYVDQQLRFDPTLSYISGLAVRDHSRLIDLRPGALRRHEQEEQADLNALRAIARNAFSEEDGATYAILQEQLESELQKRVCRAELWDVNHFDGWQSHLAEVAERQPVDSEEHRRQALRRWSHLPKFVDVEVANLRSGLRQGYSAPQSVVRRVVRQLAEMTPDDVNSSPFYSPAERSTDPAFRASFQKVLQNRVNPALQWYRAFLEREYLPQARESIAISDLPNGPACYEAFLRSSTTLQRTPREVFDLGQSTVAENVAEILKLGSIHARGANLQEVVRSVKEKPDEHFRSREDLLTYSRDVLHRAQAVTGQSIVTSKPRQAVIIEPLAAFEEQAGVGSRFEQEPDPTKPAVFRISLADWKVETRADAEITTVHETVPGHYLQKALARQLHKPTRLSQLVENDAYTEGWARYAEGLADEEHIYDTPDASVMRRLWPSRGMVVDPGLHAFHWSRQQAVDYMVASGHLSPQAADDYVDRIAVMPGQLTSYDSGASVIWALQKDARASLAERFDLRSFDDAVLEEGVVPLERLKEHLRRWIEQTRQ